MSGRALMQRGVCRGLLLAAGLLLPTWLAAATVERFAPAGVVRDVRQVSARFSEAMVPLGDPRLPSPFDIECAAAGSGRWADARTWIYDFDATLPAGMACRFTLKPSLRTLAGATFSGTTDFGLQTGGPAIRASLPRGGAQGIDEQQVFVLALDAPASKDSIEAHAYCAARTLGERLPVRLIEGRERETLLAQRRALGYQYFSILWKDGHEDLAQIKHDERAQAERSLALVQCARPLPPDTELDLVWGSGIAAAGGAATQRDQRLSYKTRAAFSASLSCERVNAAAPCVPVLPLRLSFTAPIPRVQAEAIRLGGAGEPRKPVFDEDAGETLSELRFDPPFPETATLRIELPRALHDDSGRNLVNASSFPLTVTTDAAPPLVKFPGSFGILEAAQGGVLPVTVRAVEASVPAAQIGGASMRVSDEAAVLRWMKRIDERMKGHWDEAGAYTQPGLASVFEAADGAQAFSVPAPAGGKAFEVIGIPLADKGFHVVELASPVLGAALLGQPRPRYVAASALVTDLAVHFQWGRESSLVFVTRLSDGKPVADVELRIVDGCDAAPRWSGRSGADGIARISGTLPKPAGWSSCGEQADDQADEHPLMVSARKDDDFSFVLSSWNEGLAPGDFKLPTGLWQSPLIAHTVLDRALFRAGETLSMKHYWRQHVASGLVVPAQPPQRLIIEHDGSGQTYELPLSFDAQGIAESTWTIPKEAKLGGYTLTLASAVKKDKDGNEISDDSTLRQQSGSFRVEEYRVPLMRASVQPPQTPAIAVKRLPLDVYVGYFSGGGAGGLPVRLRTQVQARTLSFKGYEDFGFNGEDIEPGLHEHGDGGYLADEAEDEPKLSAARTLPLSLDASGNAHVQLPDLPASPDPQKLVAELEYPDANGELATVRSSVPLWPAARVVGLDTGGWSANRDTLKLRAVVLDVEGHPQAGVPVRIETYSVQTHSYRKRLVGGFYAYSHSTETRKLDAGCNETSDAQGFVSCEIHPGVSGEVRVQASVRDAQGRAARASGSAWMQGKGDWWFAQGDSDRMDVIPEQREVEAGDTLRLQVRMPFREATALVTVAREGVLDAFVVPLSGRSPIIKLPIKAAYAPNAYVSVLALRPRVSDFRSRLHDFLRRLHLDRWLKLSLDGGMPTAMMDLSKPAFRLGMAPIQVGWAPHRLSVEVQPERERYKTRSHAHVSVQVRASDGSVPRDAEIAFAAVDEALLDLLPNPSQRLLDAMMAPRGVELFTSTAQMQVVGKRHYGRKSMPPGGGGGRGAARELLDSLLLWKGRVPLDAQGKALIDVPLNDALSSFKLTAIASAGADRFGSGSASIRTVQDVQILSGLAPLLREHDHSLATFTLRNTTAQALDVQVMARALADGKDDAVVVEQTQRLNLAANSNAPVSFEVTAPVGAQRLDWTLRAQSMQGELLDALKLKQSVQPVWPLRTLQATLLQIDGSAAVPVAVPQDAEPGRGGLRVQLSPSLAAGLGGVRDWMRGYAYTCFEQQLSRAIALHDREAWDLHWSRAPAFLDQDGLLRYFASPLFQGSDSLTAYALAVAEEAGWDIPEDSRNRMLQGLSAFAQGRVLRGNALDRTDQLRRRIAALAALARYQRVQPRQVAALDVDATLLPSSALIDWLELLQRVELPQAARWRAAALAQLQSRINVQGTTMTLSAAQDDGLWWLMLSADVDANRLVLTLLRESRQQPALRKDLPLLMRGALSRQQRGHWNLTNANAWGVLAVDKFAAEFEREPVSGSTSATLGLQRAAAPWTDAAVPAMELSWPAEPASLQLTHSGSGKPWALVQARAAVPLREPLSSGYRIQRTLTAVEQKARDHWSVGDVLRVRLDIEALADQGWVVVDAPIPAGATLLGSGLGRDSQLLTQGEKQDGRVWRAYEERRFDSYRAYYETVPKGKWSLEYTLRLNTAGHYALPATHVEAMYAPEMYGDLPNEALEVRAP